MPEPSEDVPGAPADRPVEAARYALLRRLAFAMRHHMVVHLQPIGMITEVMERRLKMGAPNLAQVHESMGKINGFSRAAVQSCLDVVTWLAPEDDAVIALGAGVEECLSLLRSNFSFRGFALHEDIGSADALVRRAQVRSVLPACLLALTDHAGSPAEVVVTSILGVGGEAVIRVEVNAVDGAAGFAGDAPYRFIEWRDVESLAQAEGVALQRTGDSGELRIAIARS